jgi:hypothetical protein
MYQFFLPRQKRGQQARGNPDGFPALLCHSRKLNYRMDCHVASILAMTKQTSAQTQWKRTAFSTGKEGN